MFEGLWLFIKFVIAIAVLTVVIACFLYGGQTVLQWLGWFQSK